VTVRVLIVGLALALGGCRHEKIAEAVPDGESIRDSVVFDSVLIVATQSGKLLSFNLNSSKFGHPRQLEPQVTCLGTDAEGHPLAGLEDGRVCRISTSDLNLTEIAKLPKPALWLGTLTSTVGGPTAVVAAIVDETPMRPGSAQTYSLHDLTGGHKVTITTPELSAGGGSMSFAVDHNQHVWMGIDQGEWGGWCGRLDWKTGKLQTIESPLQNGFPVYALNGVYGMTELSDGHVWAYGGTSHMGLNSSLIGRVDRGTLEVVYTNEWLAIGESRPPSKPFMPITHIVSIPNSDSLLVFSYSDVFRVDPNLKNWNRVCELPVHYRGGRPDAVGAYPSVKRVHLLPSSELDFICSTAFDGLVRYANGRIGLHPIPKRDADPTGRNENGAAISSARAR
jgi:hypothetical protein